MIIIKVKITYVAHICDLIFTEHGNCSMFFLYFSLPIH